MYFPSLVWKSGRSVNSVGAAKEHPMDPYFGCFVCWDFKVHGQYSKKKRESMTPLKTNKSPAWKWKMRRWFISFWNSPFSGEMLIFQVVYHMNLSICTWHIEVNKPEFFSEAPMPSEMTAIYLDSVSCLFEIERLHFPMIRRVILVS